MRGPVIAHASSFDRLRVRTGTGNAVFDGVHAKQIEVSSVFGSILYDGGSFEPGLAHFETQNGDVAIGVNGPADLGGRSSTGRVYTNFDHPAQVTEGGSHATVGGGGPLVTATSATGNVFFYDGSLRGRHTPADWDSLKQTLNHPAPGPGAAAAAAPRAAPPAKAPAAVAPSSATQPAPVPVHPHAHRRHHEPPPPPP
jgi:hypothetical protein